MTYQNYDKNKNIKWRMAVYIKKRFSFKLGNALLNAICWQVNEWLKRCGNNAMVLFYCPCKALLRALLVCWSLLYGWRTWGLKTACRWSFHSLKMSICTRRHQTSRLTAFYRVMVYLYYLRVKSRLMWCFVPSKAMLCSRVVLWENSKAGRVALVLWLWAGSLGCGWFGLLCCG